jgi:hypothetical protein
MSHDHLQGVSKRMRETCEAKDKELISIKAELRRLNIAHTLLMSQHAVFNLKTAQGGAEGYSQLQKGYKDLQAKYKAKEEECTLFEHQCDFLSEAFQEQSMVLPPGGPTSAHASSSIGDDLDLEAPVESLAREKLAMIIAVSMLLGATSGSLRRYMTTAGALSLAILGSPRQYMTTVISLLRRQTRLMGLTLDYLIPMVHALISLGPYMARA